MYILLYSFIRFISFHMWQVQCSYFCLPASCAAYQSLIRWNGAHKTTCLLVQPLQIYQKGMEYSWSNYSSSPSSFRAYCQPLFVLIWGSLQLCMCKSCKWMQAAVSSLPSELWIPESVCLGSGPVMSYRGINPLLFGIQKGLLHWRVCHCNYTPRRHVCILRRLEISVACGSGASSRAPPPAEQI